MAYTPTAWATGDTVTATKLNKIENGIANAGSALIVTDTNGTLDKTFAEIYDALADGVVCFIKFKFNAPSDLDDEYHYAVCFAPIVQAYKYNIDYRIYTSVPYPIAVGASTTAGSPTVWAYSANDSQSYPTFYRTIYVNSTYLVNQSGRY